MSIKAPDVDISSVLELKPELITSKHNSHAFSEEQKKDGKILATMKFLQEKILPGVAPDCMPNCSSSTNVYSDGRNSVLLR